MFKLLLAFLFVATVIVAADRADKSGRSRYYKDPIKQPYLKRHARQAQQGGVQGPVSGQPQQPQQPITIAVPTNMAEACTAAECNNRGTCFGTRQSPICLCSLGYAGTRCEDTYCDSSRDCNGRGLCMGTQSRFSCICNLGFSGERCEAVAPPTAGMEAITAPQAPVAPQQQIVSPPRKN